MNTEVLDFTRRALAKGIGPDEIAVALKSAGWSKADVLAAVDAFADIDFPLPVPRPRPYLSAQELFLYALFFTALYVTTFNLGALIFSFIELKFPDATLPVSRPFNAEGMRRNLAAVIVAFPLFLFLFQQTNRAIARDPGKRASRPRKWLTYITLFVAAAVLIGDVSALVYGVLGGELTMRFILKVATVAVIAGGPFGYFLVDMRRDERS
ncbi:MAG: hypothetical protein JWM33_3406 [Caulobacteraceae bacterium]|nr:hypothetical protein [Caulobacteraceae bacterium]